MAHCFLLRQSDPINSFRKVTFAKQNERNERGPGFKRSNLSHKGRLSWERQHLFKLNFSSLFLSTFLWKNKRLCQSNTNWLFQKRIVLYEPKRKFLFNLIQTSFRLLQNHSGLQQFMDRKFPISLQKCSRLLQVIADWQHSVNQP